MRKKNLYENGTLILELIEIKIEKTYRNLLCGLPTKKLNKIILSNEIEDVKTFSKNMFYIEPIQTEMFLKMPNQQEIPYKLPDFVYKTKIICYPPDNDLMNFNSYYFEFGALWFDNDLSIEIPQNVVEYAIEKSKSINK